MKKNAQAALEFLTTYGWALIVIIIMIAALVYFGVLNPNRAIPTRCELQPGFSCKDFLINDDQFSVIMINKNGDAIKNVSVDASLIQSDDFITASPTIVCAPQAETIGTDGEFLVQCNGTASEMFQGITGDKVKILFDVSYTPVRASYPKSLRATIFGPVVS